MPKELTAISLFSGGGGLDLGIAQAGFRTRVAVEWDRYACDTLRRAQAVKHEVAPGHAYLDGASIVQTDIRGLSAEEILEFARLEPGEASLLVGGPPCVTFSVGGLRKGLQHETGQLYEEYVRVLRHAQPSAFIFENVKGLLTAPGESGEAGGAFAAILRELEASGYALTWRLVDAADYGVPQHRHRVFVVGRKGSDPLGFPQATHARVDRVGMFGPLGFEEPWRTVQDAIADLPSAVKPGETPELANHITRSYSVEVIESFAATPPGKRNPKYKRDRLKWDEPAKAVRAQGKWKSNGSGQKNSSHQSLHPEEHRQLTVRESARIQTFPDWYEFDPTFVNGYRVVGDAVPPLLARVIAASIREQMFADAAPEKAADEPLAIAG